MRTAYTNLDIHFELCQTEVHCLNMIFERFERSIPKHSHGNGCYELHFIPRGRGTLVADDVVYEIGPGALFVTGPHIEHAQSPDPNEPMEEYCIYLSVARSKAPAKSVMEKFLAMPFWYGQDHNGLEQLMKQLFHELADRPIGCSEMISLLLPQVIIAMVRNYGYAKAKDVLPPPGNLYENTNVILDDCFLYEFQSITLEALSDRLSLSPRQTQRLIMKLYGKTFLEKRNEARMSAAVLLLRDSSKTILAISEELGYSSQGHFASSFAAYYGMPPGQFRARERKKTNR